MEEEIWKSIEGYDGLYEVSNLGRVRSLNYKRTGETKVLRYKNNECGYLFVNLCKGGKYKMFKVHRLVAMVFIPNPMGKQQVNHKNEDKTDNRVENLEWMTSKENINYGTRNERAGRAIAKTQSKPVLQYTKDGELIMEYPSTKEASIHTGLSQGNICECCLGKRKSAVGSIWKYKE